MTSHWIIKEEIPKFALPSGNTSDSHCVSNVATYRFSYLKSESY